MTPDFERRYQQAHHSRFARLLKLVVLRDVVQELHRTKSKFMTKPDSRAETLKLERHLRVLEHAPSATLNEDSIEKVLTGPRGKNPDNGDLVRFQRLLSNSRFTRPDRKWERAILEEALRKHWTVGTSKRELGFAEVQGYHEAFARGLWPDGAVLFVEGTSRQPQGAWRGRWWVVSRKSDPGVPDFVPLFVLA